MNLPNRRKLFPNNTLADVIQAARILQDDSDKIKLVFNYLKQVDIDLERKCSWIETQDTLRFLSALDIIPKESHSLFAQTNFVELGSTLLECYYNFVEKNESMENLMELVKKATKQLSEITNLMVQETHILSLMSSLERLKRIVNGANIGESVVSGAVASMFEVLCGINGHFQNGGQERSLILDGELPELLVRNDGILCATPSSLPYLLREDKSLDLSTNWENENTDSFKLILSMINTLREKIKSETAITKEQKLKYSKVLGLNFLKSRAHLFLLELELIEENQEFIPYYYMSHKSFDTDTDQVLSIFLTVLKFTIDHVPKRKYYGTNFVVHQKPFRNLSQLKQVSSISNKTISPQTKLLKKVTSYYENKENQQFFYTVLNRSFLKTVSTEEMIIIVKLVEMDSLSPHLPRILNVYEDIVEFELLESLPILSEVGVMYLVLDISKALGCLHSNQIIHRDVKPLNIMMRRFQAHVFHQFVLIDFGLSFPYYKMDNVCFDSNTRKRANENVGTHYFKAQEVHSESNYDEKIDVYSLGASVVNLMKHEQQVNNNCSSCCTTDIEKLEWKYLKFKQLVIQMIDPDPSNRPSAGQVSELIVNVLSESSKLDL